MEQEGSGSVRLMGFYGGGHVMHIYMYNYIYALWDVFIYIYLYITIYNDIYIMFCGI